MSRRTPARCSRATRPAASAFEAALLVEAAVLAGAPPDRPLRALLSLQEDDGGWPSSAALLVPRQRDGAPGAPHPDVRRLLTTATALTALGAATGAATCVRRPPFRRGAEPAASATSGLR